MDDNYTFEEYRVKAHQALIADLASQGVTDFAGYVEELSHIFDDFEHFVRQSQERGLFIDFDDEMSWRPFYVCFNAGRDTYKVRIRSHVTNRPPVNERIAPSSN
jgi:hypothetical protein